MSRNDSDVSQMQGTTMMPSSHRLMLGAESKVLLADGRFKRAGSLQSGDLLQRSDSARHVRVGHVHARTMDVPYYTLLHSRWHTASKLLLTHAVQLHEGGALLPVPAWPPLAAPPPPLRAPGVAAFAAAARRPPITPSYAVGYVLGTALVSHAQPPLLNVGHDEGDQAWCVLLDDAASRIAFAAHLHAAFPKLPAAASTACSARLLLPAALTPFLTEFARNPTCTIAANSRSAPLLHGIRDGIVRSCTSSQHALLSQETIECVYAIDMLLLHASRSAAGPRANPEFELTCDTSSSAASRVLMFRPCSLDTTPAVRCWLEGEDEEGGGPPLLVVDNLVLSGSA